MDKNMECEMETRVELLDVEECYEASIVSKPYNLLFLHLYTHVHLYLTPIVT